MRSLKLVLVGVLLFFANNIGAQISVNVTIGTPPQWAPVGYSEVQYYYIPDVEAYYDVKSSNFIYFEGGKWIHRKHLSKHYRNYNLYNGYKVVLSDYRGNTPYIHFKNHKIKYKKGYKGTYQKTYKDKHKKGNKKSKEKSKKDS